MNNPPFKVICIDDSPNEWGIPPEIIKDEHYTVIGQEVGHNTGRLHYKLAEVRKMYWVKRFVPIEENQYQDATTEIIELFKPKEETSDLKKIKVAEPA